MPLGLTVSFVMLAVIALIGLLGCVMDKQVDADDRKNLEK
jgi:hypothetical protein